MRRVDDDGDCDDDDVDDGDDNGDNDDNGFDVVRAHASTIILQSIHHLLPLQSKGELLLQNLSKCISSTATGHLSLNHVISCIQISGRLLLTDPTTITNGQVTPSLNGLCWKSHNSAFGSLDDIW